MTPLWSLLSSSSSNFKRLKKQEYERLSVRICTKLVRKFIESLQKAQISARYAALAFNLRDIIEKATETFDFESASDLDPLILVVFDFQAQSNSNYGEVILQCGTFLARKGSSSETLFSTLAQHYDFFARSIPRWTVEVLSLLVIALKKASSKYPSVFEQVMPGFFELLCAHILGELIRELFVRIQHGIKRRTRINLRMVLNFFTAILSAHELEASIHEIGGCCLQFFESVQHPKL